MADNFIANPGAGGDTFAADDIGGVKTPYSKIDAGGNGLSVPIVAGQQLAAASLPVVLASDQGSITVVGAAAHDAAVSGNPVLIAGASSAAAPTSVTADGEAVRAWFLRNGAQATVLTAAGALIGGDATNGIDVDVTRIIPGTAATNLGKAVDSTAGGTDTGVLALVLRDDVLATLTPPDNDYTQIRVDSLGRIWTAGQIAHDSPISGAPFRIGGRAQTADISAVASGDQVDLISDVMGKQIILPYALHENQWQYAGAAITDTADDVVKASAGAGVRNYVTSLTVINSHATVGTVVELKDGSTVIHRGYAAPLGGGYTVTFPTALKGTAATALNVACVTTGSNTYVNASGYVAP